MRYVMVVAIFVLIVMEPAGLRAQVWSSGSSPSSQRLDFPIPTAVRTNGFERAGHMFVELLSGTAAGLVGGILGAVVGGGVRGNPSWECGDEPGIIGLGEAFVVGAALGSAATVYALGAAQGDDGSLAATLAGAVVPAVFAIVSVEVRRDPHPDGAWWVIFTPLGATIAYNLSDLLSDRHDVGGRALLDVRGGNAGLAVPQLAFAKGRGTSRLYASAKLLSVSF